MWKSFTVSIQTIMLAVVSVSFILPTFATAQVTVIDGDVEATFSSAPLFSAAVNPAIAPSSTQSGTITVVNNGVDTEPVWLTAFATSSTGLAEAVELQVNNAGQNLYIGTFAQFFATSSVYLDDLSPGASRTYTLIANFLSNSGNEYQGTAMGFDLRIGFASGAGVSGPSSTGGTGGGGTVTNPTPGSSNSPDGIVAGAATDGNQEFDDVGWPVWDYVTAAIGDALRPGRIVSESDRGLSVATTTQEGQEITISATDQVANDQAVAIAATKGLQAKCLQLWFFLLVLLGLAARFVSQLFRADTPELAGAASWLSYLVFTGVYLLGLLLVGLTVGIGLLWGWFFFAVWTAHQIYDFGLVWLQNQSVNRLRILQLLIGLAMLFTLSPYVNWLCQWW